MKKLSYLIILALCFASSLSAWSFFDDRGGCDNGDCWEKPSDEFPSQQDEPTTNRNTVRYGAVKMKNFYMKTLTDKGKVIYVAPGMTINAYAQYMVDRGEDSTINQIIVGFDKIGAQTAIHNGRSLSKGAANFTLTAPTEPGIYEVRFRSAQAYTARDAVNYWWNVDSPPSYQATLGLVIVDEFYGEEGIERPLNDANFDEYMQSKYGSSSALPASVNIQPLLTNSIVDFSGFWGFKDGKWYINNRSFTVMATKSWNSFYHIDSVDGFENVDLIVNTQYRVTEPKKGWSYARGFGISYYVDSKHNVEFHYFPDVKQASLYIRDDKKMVEHIDRFYLPEFKDHTHHIKIENGKIYWSINGVVIIDGKTTTLKAGRLRLTSHNNDTTFSL